MSRFLAFCLFVVLLGVSPKAEAAGCGPYLHVAKFLLAKYGESPTLRGLVNEELRMEFWASDGGATWTVLHITTGEIACLASSGKNLSPAGAPTVKPGQSG